MRLILNLIIFLFFGTSIVFGYECKSEDFQMKLPSDKKSVFRIFEKTQRQTLVNNLIYNITEDKITKRNNAVYSAWLIDYLENTEQNENHRVFFKLLRVTSDIEAINPKKLNLKEVCEILEKVNRI